MVDVLTKEQRSYNMSRIRGTGTGPEMLLRKLLFSKRLRGYRVRSKVFGKPDIVFPKYGIAVFVDGCFWHRCPVCYTKPETNMEFWEGKIEGNMKRDKMVNERLAREGYEIIRFWEHEIKNNLNACYLKIYNKLKSKGFKR
jgi:DNA mismatch endonuclease (patch repair protein)